MKAFIIFLVAAGVFTACTKNQSVPPPSYQEGVFFYVPVGVSDPTGTLQPIPYNFQGTYSFYIKNLVQDTFWLPSVRVLGNSSKQNRVFNIAVLDSLSNAVAGKHYRLFTEYTMPADSFATSRAGVVVFRTPDLGDSSVTLTLQLQPSKDFPGLMMTDTLLADNSFYEGTTYTMHITQQPIQPPYWSTVSQYMGYWSRVKYEFIYSVIHVYLGLTADNVTEQQNLFNYYLEVSNALQAYNNAHPGAPLMDENGQVVSFS